MKIAILNLPVDNNYGGNLQRFALVKVLQDMGHEVEHINLRFNVTIKWKSLIITAVKRILKSIIHLKRYEILPMWNTYKRFKKRTAITDKFYKKYIPHTKTYRTKESLGSLNGYDAYIVGSDQVWRKLIAKPHGIETYFFDFLKDENAKRIAYAASLGTDENELNKEEILYLGKLYKKFQAVSIREMSGLKLLKEYDWNSPEPQFSADPTLLLKQKDYCYLIEHAKTYQCAGNLFCYILDKSMEKETEIKELAAKHSLIPFKLSLDGKVSVEQWLRSFRDAKIVITDSFHGLLFSIIFNKPYLLIKNEFRGNARFNSILNLFNLTVDETQRTEWSMINEKKQQLVQKSLDFLQRSLK